jgi:hypothetical protein
LFDERKWCGGTFQLSPLKHNLKKNEQNKTLEVNKMDENTKSYPNVSLGGKKSNEKGEGDSGHMRYGQGNKGESKGKNK